MEGLNLNSILVPLSWLFASVALVSGTFLIIRSFLRFRYQVNQSVNMDLEVIQVTRKKIQEGREQNAEAWKEEILAMEQLLSSLTALKPKGNILKRMFFDTPTIVFEIANPSSSEEIFFYLSLPKRFRESAEKQIHSFFPHAVIEKVTDYTIFSPGNHTAVSVLELVESHALPLRTYRTVDVDPLNEISNALSKLKTMKRVRHPDSFGSSGYEMAQRGQGGRPENAGGQAPERCERSLAGTGYRRRCGQGADEGGNELQEERFRRRGAEDGESDPGRAGTRENHR
jgi:hypothetical protein